MIDALAGLTTMWSSPAPAVTCREAVPVLPLFVPVTVCAPATEAVQQKQVAANPELTVWVQAVKAAKGRTSDDLGTKYPKISQPMWTAFQAALSGSATPVDALKTAQTTAASATK